MDQQGIVIFDQWKALLSYKHGFPLVGYYYFLFLLPVAWHCVRTLRASLKYNTNVVVPQPFSMINMQRSLPNILITGTPGVGKSLLADTLSNVTELEWLDVSKLAIQNECLEEYDEVYQCRVLDEEKLLDGMESLMNEGGKIVDYHGAELFPERWFDIVFVLRTNNTILYDRLKERGYNGKKLEDNIDCEIFQTILEEAKASYREEIVHELVNDNQDQLINNISRICQWLQQWKKDNAQT